MNLYAWIGLAIIFVLSGLPLLSTTYQTKHHTIRFMKTVIIIAAIIFIVEVIHIPFIVAFVIGAILYILLSKKTYTKKRGIIYGSSLFVFVAASFIIGNIFFKSNPDSMVKHLLKNPKDTSLYVAINGDEQISYHADVPRPLASVAKTMVAVEYAYQIDEGVIQKDDMVALDDLASYFIKNTDGGAHEEWLGEMKELSKIQENSVTLNDVAKGMMTYSSNANTDYLIDLLGIESINNRIKQLGFIEHSPIIPFVGALVTVNEFKEKYDGSDWMNTLSEMPETEFITLVIQNSEKLKHQEIDLEAAGNLALDEQRIWSDRLANASAKDYAKLLHKISNDEFPGGVSQTIRELMEWPMEKVEGNKEHYNVIGAKGGSTAFVLNQTMYVEDLDGNKFELILFTDNLSLWKSIILQNHVNGFMKKLISDEGFRGKIQGKLTTD